MQKKAGSPIDRSTPPSDGRDHEPMPFEEDFLRGSDNIVTQLTETLDQSPDVGQPYASQSWDTITRLAWRPAWSIRSRRGALEPLIAWWRRRRQPGSAD